MFYRVLRWILLSTAAAHGVRARAHAATPPRGQAGAREGAGGQDRGAARPADTPSVPATPLAPLEGACRGPGPAARACAGVALDPLVAIRSPAPRREAVDAGGPWPLPVRLPPGRAPVARARPWLARGAARDPRPTPGAPPPVHRRLRPGGTRRPRRRRVVAGEPARGHGWGLGPANGSSSAAGGRTTTNLCLGRERAIRPVPRPSAVTGG